MGQNSKIVIVRSTLQQGTANLQSSFHASTKSILNTFPILLSGLEIVTLVVCARYVMAPNVPLHEAFVIFFIIHQECTYLKNTKISLLFFHTTKEFF